MIAAGFGAAGVLLLISLVARRRLPKWAVPSVAGLAMFSFAIWNEYSWYPRVRDALPDTVKIVSAPVESAFWQPWSYAFPLTKRFIALDLGAAVHSETSPNEFVAPVMVVARWTPTQNLPVAFDCAGGRRADLFRGGQLLGGGQIEGAEWVTPGPEDELLAAACNGG